MSRVKELIALKNLQAALAEAQVEVVNDPDNVELRSLLFELLMVEGSFEKALEQVDVLTRLDAMDKDVLAFFRRLIEAAEKRRRFYELGEGGPGSFMQPPDYGECFMTATVAHAQNRPGIVEECLQEADPPGISGRLVTAEGLEVEFSDFEDMADLHAPFLPALVPGEFLWLPWESVRKLEFDQSSERSLFETIFRPARLQLQIDSSHTQDYQVWVPMVYHYNGPDWEMKMSGDLRLTRTEQGYSLTRGWRVLRATIDNEDDDRLFAAQGIKTIEIDERSE